MLVLADLGCLKRTQGERDRDRQKERERDRRSIQITKTKGKMENGKLIDYSNTHTHTHTHTLTYVTYKVKIILLLRPFLYARQCRVQCCNMRIILTIRETAKDTTTKNRSFFLRIYSFKFSTISSSCSPPPPGVVFIMNIQHYFLF